MGSAALAMAVMLVLLGGAAANAAQPGLALGPRTPEVPTALTDLFYSETGQFYLSVDAKGSNDASHQIRVDKPNASATVRKAFLLAASTGGNGDAIGNGSLLLQGTGITWDAKVPSNIGSYNYRVDATSIVKPVVDAAGAGIVMLTITEGSITQAIDGEILAVVFDDPTQAAARSIIMLFGAQATAGDDFDITLAEPIDPGAPGVFADMGLGISYSYQSGGSQQYSLIDVNGTRLTTSAGGEDDGIPADGGLITVGGIGDSNDNPPDPNATPTNPRSDDELYSLLPFLTVSTTSVTVHTQNPSNDDNIFYAYFDLSGAAIVGAGIVLGPASATNPVGTDHTVTATVVDDTGAPLPGVTVTFNVTAGPNAGKTGMAVTNASGQAMFTYHDDGGAGIDQIQASALINEQTVVSNLCTKNWGGQPQPTPTPTAPAEPIPTMGGSGLLAFIGLLMAAGVLVLVLRRGGA